MKAFKRITALILSLSLTFLAVGCGSDETPASENAPTPEKCAHVTSAEDYVTEHVASEFSGFLDLILPTLEKKDPSLNYSSHLTKFLSYYKYSSGNYTESFVFNFAATVMQMDTANASKDNCEFVKEGGRDKFLNRFSSIGDILTLDKTVYYCRAHDYHGYNSGEICPDCQNAVPEETVAELLFITDSGEINTDAIAAYPMFVREYAIYSYLMPDIYDCEAITTIIDHLKNGEPCDKCGLWFF